MTDAKSGTQRPMCQAGSSPASTSHFAPRTSHSPRVSLIVPTHNRAPLLEALLESVRRLDWDPRLLEVWVVGDPEIEDDSQEVVARFAKASPFPVRYLQSPNSPAAKRNSGMRASTGSILAFTDDDCVVDPHWLRRGCAGFTDPSVVGVQGQTVVPEVPGNPASTLRTRRLMEPNYQTCNILYRREALERIGGFDERFRAAISEDSDLAFSVLESGGRITHCPEALVHHPPREDSAWDLLRAARHNYYAPLLYKKHPGRYRERIGTPLPRAARVYFALDVLALAGLALGAPGMALCALGVYAVVLGAQVARYCRGDRRLRRAVATAFSLSVAPYAAYYFLAAGNLRFRSRLWW